MAKANDAFRTIGEVSDELDVPKHVLRFWEGKFPQLKPMKRGGGRRFYRPEDVTLLRGIHHLLHAAGYTIKGVQRILRESGVDAVKTATHGAEATAAEPSTVSSAPDQPARRRGRASPQSAAGSALSTSLVKELSALLAEMESCLALLRGTEPKQVGEARVAATKTKR